MFTGIVTAVGTVRAIDDGEDLRRIRIETPEGWLSDTAVGDSIALDGACLTPVEIDGETFVVEAVRSTLDRTRASVWTPGAGINLEKALRVGDRLDGHWVQGHVDGMGRLEEVRKVGGTRFVEVSLPEDVWALTILHGSITLNGISLTVNALTAPDRCEVAIIPHTWTHTNLSSLAPGDPVNVEGDMMGKYARKILGPRPGSDATES
ncbi:MAG TPA: riboflavin synthase [Longimicrobiales bacterium]|nr:riboflavin synthase [Longimicrobiales bacterium]